jgi:septum formation protein
MGQIILASASPRRKELLEQVGVEFEICPAKGEEIITSEIPEEVVIELAGQKALEVASMVASYGKTHEEVTVPQDILVIGADTVVACPAPPDGGTSHILGKPKDEEDAFRMLTALSGRTHSVYTGVSFVFLSASGRTGQHSFYEKTDVVMQQMSEQEIKSYIATGEPMDKAGAYGIQGKCAIYIDKIIGDYNNVVGLPVAAIYRELKKLGIDWYQW